MAPRYHVPVGPEPGGEHRVMGSTSFAGVLIHASCGRGFGSTSHSAVSHCERLPAIGEVASSTRKGPCCEAAVERFRAILAVPFHGMGPYGLDRLRIRACRFRCAWSVWPGLGRVRDLEMSMVAPAIDRSNARCRRRLVPIHGFCIRSRSMLSCAMRRAAWERLASGVGTVIDRARSRAGRATMAFHDAAAREAQSEKEPRVAARWRRVERRREEGTFDVATTTRSAWHVVG